MSAKKVNEEQEAELTEGKTTPEEAAEAAEANTVQEAAAEPQLSEAEKLKAQAEELNNKLLRTLAEYDNYRKRSQKERMELYPEAISSTVSKFLPVLDNFERALQTDCADTEFKKGIEMIFTSFKECLKGLNVEEIEPTGESFDPNLHNAVMHIEDEKLGENTVSAVLQKGYKIGDKILRHAMVQVAN